VAITRIGVSEFPARTTEMTMLIEEKTANIREA
jgi:hypothetical protein